MDTTLAATRQIQWNVAPAMLVFLYASAALALAVFAYGWWLRVRVWRVGAPAVRTDRLGERFVRMLGMGFGHGSLLRRLVPGLMHAAIFAGFGVLFAATLVVFVDHDLHEHIMHGAFFLYFQSLTVNLFGLFVLIGVGVAAWRRYLRRVPQLEPERVQDAWILGGLAAILVTGYLLDGLRIAATHDPWGPWAPVGYVIALGVLALGASDAALGGVHATLWVFHVALWHGALASIPFTKMRHMVTGPLNIFFGELGPAHDVPSAIDFDNPPAVLGVRTPLDLTWKQLLDLDACTECGRCQSVCPAYAEDKPLSPKRVVLDVRDHVHANAALLVAAATAARNGDAEGSAKMLADLPPLAGGVIASEALWACTTCRACEDICPVSIEHVPLITGMRRFLAMEEADVPSGVAEAMGHLETRQRPFPGAGDRSEWYRELQVRELGDVPAGTAVDVLYWVGCAAAFDERVRNIARSLATIMDAAGMAFAVLGAGEQCCGEPARRTGNEMHYDQLARANMETFTAYGVKQIVTHCPHCLQTLRRDYAQLGATYTVVHHTELLQELLQAGRLPVAAIDAAAITYHDPCYLGRYNGVFDAPRDVIDLIGGQRLEMERSGRESFCCGSGGGHAFYDDPSGGRINANRAREAIATGATTIATGCPFCLSMMEDGVKRVQPDGATRVRDVAEIVADALRTAIPEKVEEHG